MSDDTHDKQCEYIHDEWCDDDACGCYVRLLEQKDAKIARQAEIITKLEASRTGLKKQNKELRFELAEQDTPEVRSHFPSGKTIADAIYKRPLEFLPVLPLALIHGDLQSRLWRFVYGTR